MYENLFRKEYERLERVREILDDPEMGEEELREALRTLSGHYNKLLERTVKITKIGDVNQRKLVKAARRVHDHALRLRKANKEKNEVISVVAHDLRSPVNIILSMIDGIMGRELAKDDGVRSGLDKIKETGSNMLSLIEDLLGAMRLDANKDEMRFEEKNVNALLTKIGDTYQPLAHQKNIALKCIIPEEPILVRLDERRFWEICNNLLSNALKFTHDEGTVILSLEERNYKALIKVQDDGIGIPEDKIEQVFDKFSKASRPGTRGEATTGLGLSITRQLVERHYGKVWVESEVGVGTTFLVELPVA